VLHQFVVGTDHCLNCWSRPQLGMPCTGLWFNIPPGIRPCPLYTPPVALTDGPICELEGLALLEINLSSRAFIYFSYRNLRKQHGLKGSRCFSINAGAEESPGSGGSGAR